MGCRVPCCANYDSLVHEVSTRSSRLITVFRRLRPEEGLLAIAFVASAVLTIYANLDLYQQRINSRRIQGGLLRLAVVVGLAASLPWLERTLRRRQGSRWWLATAEFVRTFLPFVMCIAVYTNLHDTVRYVNTHDIHAYLSAIEEWIFGGQPVLWAEAYITPARTEFFNAFYANFYLVAPSVVLILWFSGRSNEARTVLLGIIVCFYTGYVLYVLLPAAPPRLYYASLGLFHVTLRGGPITNFQEYLIGMMPNHAARAAFPSLHSAVSCLSLYYAWKYCRWYFPILLVFVLVLLASTVYLRHHWVVDLLAGTCLVPWTVWLAPRYERWWKATVNGQPTA
jgi:membrane-associated phospholipid phosphatase